MRWTTSRRRRIGIIFAVLLPLAILFQGLSQVVAQFPNGGGVPQPPIGPRPPGFNPPGSKPPGFKPPGPGFNPAMGPKQPFGGVKTYEWRCSKCQAVVATTNNPFNPGMNNCPRCGVHFINGGGGKGGLLPPPNLPNGPPAGFPPNGAPPGAQPPNGPPAEFQPPAGGPPADFAPPNVPPAVAAPLGAPPADAQVPAAAPDDPAPVVGNDCSWCGGEVAGANDYCTDCKLKMGGVLLGGTVVMLGAVIVPLGLLGWFMLRSGGR
jgi:hypothetical protein